LRARRPARDSLAIADRWPVVRIEQRLLQLLSQASDHALTYTSFIVESINFSDIFT
jgi:hypothetical protein